MASRVSYDDACVLGIPGDGQQLGEVALRYVAGLDISTDDGHVQTADLYVTGFILFDRACTVFFALSNVSGFCFGPVEVAV